MLTLGVFRFRGPEGFPPRQAPACPARGAARPVTPCPAHKRTPGGRSELAFDSKKKRQNYTNPLTGSVHAFRGLPSDRANTVSVHDFFLAGMGVRAAAMAQGRATPSVCCPLLNSRCRGW